MVDLGVNNLGESNRVEQFSRQLRYEHHEMTLLNRRECHAYRLQSH